MVFPKLTSVLAIATIALMGSVSVATAEPFRLVVTDLEAPLVPNSVMDLAVNLGYFEREGVEVELVRVQQTPSAVAALQSGEGEMANIAVDTLLQLVSRGDETLKAVVSPNKSLPYLIAAKQEITSPAELKGRSFGVGRVGSLDHSLSTLVLGTMAVDMNTLEVVTLGQPATRAQALAAGQIDSTTMSIGTWTSMPDKTGVHILVGQDDYYKAAPVVNKVNVVTTSVLENRHDEVESVIRALVKISRDITVRPEVWVEGMAAARPDVSRENLQELVTTFAESWSVNGGMSRQELQYTADWLYKTPDFQGLAPVGIEAWVDFSLVDAVLADLGTDGSLDQPTR